MKTSYRDFLHPDELSDLSRSERVEQRGDSQTSKVALARYTMHAYQVLGNLRCDHTRLRDCVEAAIVNLDAGRGKNYQEIIAALKAELTQ